MHVKATRETVLSDHPRVRQLEGMFDVPRSDRSSLVWEGEVPIEAGDWNVGLIVGPSGSGKSTLLRELCGEPRVPTWGAPSVVEDFDPALSMEDIAAACSAVGFNTVPAWMRPYGVLFNGEQFRVGLARLLVEAAPGSVVAIDEFTSVVDRQVAKIGAHAVQKFARARGLRLVVATCHYDVTEWLRPDWVLEPAGMRFERTAGRWERRPGIDAELRVVPRSLWELFAPYHYLTADLSPAARCYALFVDGRPVAFAGVVHRPHPIAKDIFGVSRLVTLPDWQGLGLAFVLCDYLGAAYRGCGRRLHMYPAHPALVRGFRKSMRWELRKDPGYEPRQGLSARSMFAKGGANEGSKPLGRRPCAVFGYVGDAMRRVEAEAILFQQLEAKPHEAA